MERLDFAKPKVVPPLDPDFRPAALFSKHLQDSPRKCSIGVWRGTALQKVHEFPLQTESSNQWIERTVKFLLWQVGGDRLTIHGCDEAIPYLQSCYSPTGARKFDNETVGVRMFDRALTFKMGDPQVTSSQKPKRKSIGRHLNGCRVGFDLGASDRKVAAVVDGETVFAEETVWDPRRHTDPAYHRTEIVKAIRSAAVHMPRLDAIGGSTAGVVVDNRMMVSSLFRGVPDDQDDQVRDVFLDVKQEFGVPLEVANDGDVTALAGSMALETGRLLGIAMGSSEAAGYIDEDGDVTGWLNELAFTPIDLSKSAPADEWSGDIGCGVQYLTQQAVFRLAGKVGIDLGQTPVLAEKLKVAQERLEAGDEAAELIWRTIGVYFGYALAHYCTFYDLSNVLLLGRVASGRGGAIIVEECRQVLDVEFTALSRQLIVNLPDEKTRRVGQAVAAASLPALE